MSASSIGWPEERGHQSIIHRVSNIIFTEFLCLSAHSLCGMQVAKFGYDVKALKGVFNHKALL